MKNTNIPLTHIQFTGYPIEHSPVLGLHPNNKSDQLKIATQFASQMFKYSGSKNNADVDIKHISTSVMPSFLECREAMGNYLKQPNDANLSAVVAKINAMEEKVKGEPKSISRSSRILR